MVFIKIPVEKFNIKFEEWRSLFQLESFIYMADDLDNAGMDEIVSYNQNSLTFEIYNPRNRSISQLQIPSLFVILKVNPFLILMKV
jgi:hypothetical protein